MRHAHIGRSLGLDSARRQGLLLAGTGGLLKRVVCVQELQRCRLKPSWCMEVVRSAVLTLAGVSGLTGARRQGLLFAQGWRAS